MVSVKCLLVQAICLLCASTFVTSQTDPPIIGGGPSGSGTGGGDDYGGSEGPGPSGSGGRGGGNSQQPGAILNERRGLQNEINGDYTRDVQWTLDLTSKNERPRGLPSNSQAKRVYRNQINRVLQDARNAGDNSLRRAPRQGTSQSYRYYTLENWLKPVVTCCPKRWDYSCRSTSMKLPCFSYWSNGAREWCCPMWPSVFVQRCACKECAILTDTCVYKGNCRSRYRKQSFIAVCYRNNGWNTLRYLSQYHPTSCYCHIHK